MARSPADAYELSDTEKRDLIKLFNEGKPFPEKYRFLLFADKREVEPRGASFAFIGTGHEPAVHPRTMKSRRLRGLAAQASLPAPPGRHGGLPHHFLSTL